MQEVYKQVNERKKNVCFMIGYFEISEPRPDVSQSPGRPRHISSPNITQKQTRIAFWYLKSMCPSVEKRVYPFK